jgi:anti-anti-sigma factor
MDVSYVLDYPTVPRAQERRLHLLVRIETWPEEGGEERKPLNVAVVIDKSGSMAGDKLERTKDAACLLVDELGPQDVMSVVTYAGTVEVPVPPSAVTDKEAITVAIRGITAGGTTNLSGGWLKGLSLLGEREGEKFLHRTLLLTDGIANRGVIDDDELVEIARQHRSRGLTTTTIGFGTDFNEQLLGAVAREGGGRFHYVGSPDEAPDVFLDEFGELARVFGQNLEVRIDPAPGVGGPDILGEQNIRHDQRAATVLLGDLRERDRKQALAVLTIPGALEPGEPEIATVHVAYDAVRGNIGRRQHVLPVTVEVTQEKGGKPEPDPEVVLEVVLHEIGCMKREAMRRMDTFDLDGAQAWLQRALRLVTRHTVFTSEVLDREGKALKRTQELAKQQPPSTPALPAGTAPPAKPASDRKRRDLTMRMRTYIMDASAVREKLMRRKPDVDVKKYTLSPDTSEQQEDIAQYVRSTLREFSHAEEFVDRALAVARELVANALEHGCKGTEEPRVDVELRSSRSYFKVVVEDNGEGFDSSGALEQAELAAADPTKARGRGLLMVKQQAQELVFNETGNRVSATLSKEPFTVTIDETVSLAPGGVGRIGIVKVDGSLDAHTVDKFESDVGEAVARGLSCIVLDLTECRYISSRGIGAIMTVARRAEKAQGKLVLAGVRKSVRKIFDTMGLDAVLTVAETVEDARRMFESG